MGKPVVLIVVGVTFAGIAALMTLGYLKNQKGNVIEAKVDTASVVVAQETIPRGQFVKPEQVKVVEWPSATAPEAAFSSVDQVVGKLARTAIYRNDALTQEKVLDNRRPSVLSMLIPDGRRAISIKVNEVTGISGFVAPGSRVDVLLTVAGNQTEPARSRIVLQDVEVLAIAQSIENNDTKPTVVNTVTVNVTPEQAERLTLSSNEGNLQLVLRNDQDDQKVTSRGVNLEQVIGNDTGLAGSSVELIRGHDRTRFSF
jgi:pilus assembly protein CpaB